MNIKVKNTENDQVGTRADLIQDYVICKNDEIVIYDLDDKDIDTKFDYVKGSFADPEYLIQLCHNQVDTIRAKFTRYEAETMLFHLDYSISNMNIKFKGE